MKTHTSSFKTKISTFGRELDTKITYSLNGSTQNLGGEELNMVSLHYEGAILKSVMKQFDIDSNVDIPINTVLNAQFGVKINSEYEYITLGNFVVYSSEKQEDTQSWKITCYDKMLYAMKDYEKLNITYPITIRNYIDAICDKVGLTFANASDNFANYNKQLTRELYLDNDGETLGYTYRDILDELAQVTASTICINNNDEIEIRYINDTSDTIDEEFLKNINVNFGEKYGPINSLVLARSADSDKTDPIEDSQSIVENGLCQVKISDNQILNWDDREIYMQDIFNKLNGLEYYLNDFSSTGVTYYDLCDRYNVSIGSQTYSCVMFNDEINITQGLEENVHTNKPEEDTPVYKKSDKEENKVNQAYIIADKANAKIDEVVSSVGSDGEVTAASIILAINGDTSQISIDADKIDINGAISANGTFSVSQQGYMEATGGKIGSYEITDGKLISSYYAKYNYTQEDVQRARNISLGIIQPTDLDYDMYDLNEDGVIGSNDVLTLVRIIAAGVTTSSPLTIVLDSSRTIDAGMKISSNNYSNTFALTNITLTDNTNTMSIRPTGITYNDGIKNYSITPNIFSTEEREVGTWINGKPLYQKTYEVLAQMYPQITHGIQNIDLIWIDLSNSFGMEINDPYWSFNQGVWANAEKRPRFIVNKTMILCDGDSSGTYYNWYITVKYTKTTD